MSEPRAPERLHYSNPRDIAMARPKTSVAAIVSLVLGILLCVPVLTSALAVVFGIVGIRKTATPEVQGRGLAITGLVLGLVGVLGWAMAGVGVWTFIASSAQPRAVARQFATDLSAGDIDAAAGASVPEMPREDLEKAAEALRSFGNLRDVSFSSIHANTAGGATTWELGGTAVFDKKTSSITVTLRKTSTGTYQVMRFNFR